MTLPKLKCCIIESYRNNEMLVAFCVCLDRVLLLFDELFWAVLFVLECLYTLRCTKRVRVDEIAQIYKE